MMYTAKTFAFSPFSMHYVHSISVFMLCLPEFVEFPISTLSVLLCRGSKIRLSKFAIIYNYHPFFPYFLYDLMIKNSVFCILRIDKIWVFDYNEVEFRRGGVWMELTKSEMEIMDVLWESGQPLSRSDLLERSEEKTWKDSSVHILLNGLLQKGAIREAGLVKRSKTYGRVFSPTMSREEYFATTIFSHRHKPEIVGLFDALLRREDISQEDLQKISDLVSQRTT